MSTSTCTYTFNSSVMCFVYVNVYVYVRLEIMRLHKRLHISALCCLCQIRHKRAHMCIRMHWYTDDYDPSVIVLIFYACVYVYANLHIADNLILRCLRIRMNSYWGVLHYFNQYAHFIQVLLIIIWVIWYETMMIIIVLVLCVHIYVYMWIWCSKPYYA